MGIRNVPDWPGQPAQRMYPEVYEAMQRMGMNEVILVDGNKTVKEARLKQGTFTGYGRQISDHRGSKGKPSLFQTTAQALGGGEGFGVYIRRRS